MRSHEIGLRQCFQVNTRQSIHFRLTANPSPLFPCDYLQGFSESRSNNRIKIGSSRISSNLFRVSNWQRMDSVGFSLYLNFDCSSHDKWSVGFVFLGRHVGNGEFQDCDFLLLDIFRFHFYLLLIVLFDLINALVNIDQSVLCRLNFCCG